ncbi:tetratricopeptide repeat protein [Fulvivirga sp. RKSG066]|uniref:tetratricopeptide repeat protein n=1 Tax=Fulvivirga aurantia TaxID=2529383 RepID=UPI0012BCE932|nr:tetratricopeptide repeat protein [Fulvivirga aurantia]MTI20479.1 tetratricopeptide repeat protein [Fulvivirga aurantia]
MNRIITTVSFLCLLATGLHAQTTYLDSLKNQLNSNKAYDTTRVVILLDLAFAQRNSIPDSTIYYAQEALALSKELKFPSGHAQAMRNIALGYVKKGNYDTALYLSRKALKIAVENNLLERQADVYNTLGSIHYYKGNYDSSALAFEETAIIYDSVNRPIDVAGARSNIGTIYEIKGDYPRALENYQKALLVFEELGNDHGIATVSHNMASIFSEEGENEKALEYYKRTAKIDSANNDLRGFATTKASIASIQFALGDTTQSLNSYFQSLALFNEAQAECRVTIPMSNIGDIYLIQDKLDSAYSFLSRAYSIATNCNDPQDISKIAIDLGKYFMAINNNDEAIKYFRVSFEKADEESLLSIKATAAGFLYEIYKERDNTRRALYYLEIEKNINEEIRNSDKSREIAQLEATYNLEKEKQAFAYSQQIKDLQFQEDLEQEKMKQRLLMITAFVFIVLSLVSLWLFILTIRSNKKLDAGNKEITLQNAQIIEQNEEIKIQRDQLEERGQLVEQQRLDLIAANKELKDLNEEKNTIIGIVAHDLKSPINQILGLLELIKMQVSDPPEDVKQYMDLIKTSSTRSLAMIDQILDVNAIENRDLQLNLSEVNLKELLKSQEEQFDQVATKKSISLNFETDINQTTVKTDKILLGEIMDNLISNALKFSQANKQVDVILGERNNTIYIAVKDQGPGISTDDQQVMFNKYQKLTASPTANEPSSGLGLAIVKRYIDALGYKLKCESKLDEGTVFTVEIPKNK